MLKLETAQSERFARLFDGLIDYVHGHLREEGALGTGAQDNRDELMRTCHEAIWGREGDLSLIDRFVEDDPVGLTDADRAEVLAWKEGIYYFFPVLCQNDAMLFVYGNRALVVRGSVEDIFDFMETVPGTVRCVILPFDGRVTVGTWMQEIGCGLPHHIESSCQDTIDYNNRQNLIIDTAEQFMAAAPDLRALMRHAEDELAASKREEVPSATEHRGALAGLAWDERDAALRRRQSQTADADALAAVEASCVRSVPRTVDTAVRRLKRDVLDEFSRTQRLYQSIQFMNKKEAADYVVAMLSVGTTLVVQDVMRRGGTRLLEQFRDVTLAGGRLSVADTDLDAVRRLPATFEPYLYVTHKDGCYQASLIREVYEVLEVIDWWDEALEQARRVDEAVHVVESLASFRGIITYGELENTILKYVEDEEVDEDEYDYIPGVDDRDWSELDLVLGALRFRGWHDMISCRLVEDLFDGTILVADVDAGGPIEAYFTALFIDPWVRDMLAYRKEIPPRDMADVHPGEGVFDWMRNKASYQNLVAFLDEHVPNGEDDYAFADEVATHLVGEVRRAIYFADMRMFCDMVLKDASITDEAQAERLRTLVSEVVYDVPRWLQNGWSAWERRK